MEQKIHLAKSLDHNLKTLRLCQQRKINQARLANTQVWGLTGAESLLLGFIGYLLMSNYIRGKYWSPSQPLEDNQRGTLFAQAMAEVIRSPDPSIRG